MRHVMKRADKVQPGDVIVLGPCEPRFTVVSVKRDDLRDGWDVRAQPDRLTGEEGEDGCEMFCVPGDELFTVEGTP